MPTHPNILCRFIAHALPALALAGCAQATVLGGTTRAPGVTVWEPVVVDPEPSAQPSQTTRTVADFAGSYDSNWGGCTFDQSGSYVAGSCERAYELACFADGANLDCGWISPRKGTHGRTSLTLERDGVHMNGPWGYDDKATGGGTWEFTRR